MPSSTSGFSGTEIVEHIKRYVGRESSAFQTFIEQSLPLCEFRYCKMHDWSFLRKQNLALTVVSGTAEYDLSVANIGYYMAASDVTTIFNTANNAIVKKTTLERIRQMDPNNDDGTTSDQITHWAPAGDARIVVYPKTFATTSLRIDGIITPVALSTLSNYPTIPYRFQEGFMEYVKAVALDRENDDRANGQMQKAMSMIRQDIQSDLAALGDTDEPRIKHGGERASGLSNNLQQMYDQWALWGFGED